MAGLFDNILSGSSTRRARADEIRPDGSFKDVGFLGPLKLPNGAVATEYSFPLFEEGQFGTPTYRRGPDIPSLVPTLTPDEIKLMTTDIIPNRKPLPRTVVEKARAHAKQRMAQGLSPFFSRSEGQR